jgi:hypothetical protein
VVHFINFDTQILRKIRPVDKVLIVNYFLTLSQATFFILTVISLGIDTPVDESTLRQEGYHPRSLQEG